MKIRFFVIFTMVLIVVASVNAGMEAMLTSDCGLQTADQCAERGLHRATLIMVAAALFWGLVYWLLFRVRKQN